MKTYEPDMFLDAYGGGDHAQKLLDRASRGEVSYMTAVKNKDGELLSIRVRQPLAEADRSTFESQMTLQGSEKEVSQRVGMSSLRGRHAVRVPRSAKKALASSSREHGSKSPSSSSSATSSSGGQGSTASRSRRGTCSSGGRGRQQPAGADDERRPHRSRTRAANTFILLYVYVLFVFMF